VARLAKRFCDGRADKAAGAGDKREIGTAHLDPFVETHGVPENDNGAIDRVARTFAEIADKANCSV
jgi:hypothetical protein